MRIVNCNPIYKSVSFRPLDARHVFKENGRWGPKWLHKLVSRIVFNLGMVEANIVRERITVFNPTSLGDAERTVKQAVLGYLQENFRREDLVCYIGSRNWAEYLNTDSARCTLIASDYFGHSHFGERIVNIPCVVMPNFEGVFVAPRADYFFKDRKA